MINHFRSNLFARIIQKIMLITLAIYPFGLTAIELTKSVCAVWDRHGVYYLLALIAVVQVSMVLVTFSMSSKPSTKRKVACAILLFCVSFIIRTLTACIVQTQPINDFARCFDYATSSSTLTPDNPLNQQLARFPYLAAYAVTLEFFFKIFPSTIFSAQVLNALVTSCIPVFLFWGTQKMTGNARPGVLVGMTYALYQPLIVYAAIPSCEHYSQFFLALSFLILTYIAKQEYSGWRVYILSLLLGISIGLLFLYKELYFVLIPTVLMGGFCFDILPNILLRIQRKKSQILHALSKTALVACVAIITYSGSAALVQNRLIGTNYNRSDPLMLPVYRGLAVEGRGVWSASVNEYVDSVVAENPEEANSILFHKLIEEYHNQPMEFIKVIWEKFKTDWCQEAVYWYWTFGVDTNILQGTWIGELLFAVLPNVQFMFICFGLAVGLLVQAFRKRSNAQYYGYFFASGVVFLFTFMLILMEAQGRYKSSIMPMVFVLYGISVFDLIEVCREMMVRLYGRIKDKEVKHI